MAKKGKRNEIDEPEAKSLASLPRAEKTDLTSAIIRATTKKNEDLLNNKMLKKDVKSGQVQKKNVAKSNLESNLNKLRMERAIMQSDILQDKILKSKQRSKQVQLTRKQNWDAINQAANEVIRSRSGTPADNGETPEQDEQPAEDAMEEEDKFYSDDEEESTSEYKPQRNAFDLLNDEVEA
ncbi:unnamed protein product [Wickerhamomyces anomalus]